jgi:HEAT repeat protein
MATPAGVDELVRAVREKDYAAQLQARRLGPPAAAPLTPLLGDPDADVRELAVLCLAETREARAGELLVPLVVDADPQVAMAAAKALHTVGGPAVVGALLGLLPRIDEALIRREATLVVGRFGDAKHVPLLRDRLKRETAPEGIEALQAALGRLGDVAARDAFVKTLQGTEGTARARWLELAEYIGQTWLLGPLASVLADDKPVVRVAVDARPDLIQALRACDVAVVLIAKIGGAKFSFAVTRGKNYSTTEIQEARRFVQTP